MARQTAGGTARRIIGAIDALIAELERSKEHILAGLADRPQEPATEGDARPTVAQRLLAHWGQVPQEGIYQGQGFTIDLRTTEGRAQMLVYANLLAARVRTEAADRTFAALRAAGLLDPERLARGEAADRQQALAILQVHYRGLVDKAAKVEAIYANQARLAAVWGGDLNNIYLAHAGDDAQLIAELCRFAHLKRRALWLTRELKAHGVWPNAGPGATAYYDWHVRRPLRRLGFIAVDDAAPWWEAADACERAVSAWFGGEVLPLYLHGRTLCAHNDRSLCGEACPVKEHCSFWAGKGERFVPREER